MTKMWSPATASPNSNFKPRMDDFGFQLLMWKSHKHFRTFSRSHSLSVHITYYIPRPVYHWSGPFIRPEYQNTTAGTDDLVFFVQNTLLYALSIIILDSATWPAILAVHRPSLLVMMLTSSIVVVDKWDPSTIHQQRVFFSSRNDYYG
mmetsp:Transcript_27128/g.74805  ORF Transcript_27128/g.74805 Transcript_27128/m.74805 type:complete len:148 (-) Transcript_27128:372-815(-)